jgi:endonuclease G
VYDIQGNSASFIFDQDLPKIAKYCEQKISYQEMNNKIPYSMPNLIDSNTILQRLGC